jgi:hypothetical protein
MPPYAGATDRLWSVTSPNCERARDPLWIEGPCGYVNVIRDEGRERTVREPVLRKLT